VIRFTRHFRGLLVALAVVALSAGAVLAGQSAAPTSIPSAAAGGLEHAAAGLKRASDASGKTVPVAAPDENSGADEDADESEPAEDQPAEDQSAAEHPDNHGADVSAAAQTATPDGFDNHGQYVRSIATDNAGAATSAEHRNENSKGAKPPSH
jgi:hypothetical protein